MSSPRNCWLVPRGLHRPQDVGSGGPVGRPAGRVAGEGTVGGRAASGQGFSSAAPRVRRASLSVGTRRGSGRGRGRQRGPHSDGGVRGVDAGRGMVAVAAGAGGRGAVRPAPLGRTRGTGDGGRVLGAEGGLACLGAVGTRCGPPQQRGHLWDGPRGSLGLRTGLRNRPPGPKNAS